MEMGGWSLTGAEGGLQHLRTPVVGLVIKPIGFIYTHWILY